MKNSSCRPLDLSIKRIAVPFLYFQKENLIEMFDGLSKYLSTSHKLNVRVCGTS